MGLKRAAAERAAWRLFQRHCRHPSILSWSEEEDPEEAGQHQMGTTRHLTEPPDTEEVQEVLPQEPAEEVEEEEEEAAQEGEMEGRLD